MVNSQQFKKALQQIRIVRAPRHRLATFGSTEIEYRLVTDVPGLKDRARLRIGRVTAERPSIITAETMKERFSGFGDDARTYANWLVSHFGEALKGVEYTFHNEPVATRVELTDPEKLAAGLAHEFDREGGYRQVILLGPDRMWELSIMKFIVEETLSSFQSNLQELKERGLLDGSVDNQHQVHMEIRHLFRKAREDAAMVSLLGKKLKDEGLFERYQDEFFALIR